MEGKGNMPQLLVNKYVYGRAPKSAAGMGHVCNELHISLQGSSCLLKSDLSDRIAQLETGFCETRDSAISYQDQMLLKIVEVENGR